MVSDECLTQARDDLAREALTLAGGPRDLAQRAMVYHHLYVHSGGNHIFPLIAAHGALWAGGYFANGLKRAAWLAWLGAISPQRRSRRLALVAAFADAFREINRQVCVDTYINYHFTARFGDDPRAELFVPPSLLEQLRRVHAARRQGCELADAARRQVFEAHFLNEQETVVGPSIAQAVGKFRWPLVRWLALRPTIRFAYFPLRHALRFQRFDDVRQRIAHGLRAFDLGMEVGWHRVEQALQDYGLLPDDVFVDSVRHFGRLRWSLLAAA